METHKAMISRIDDKHYLSLKIGEIELKIPLTEDEPSTVRQVFNNLVVELKKKAFTFKFEKGGEDLFQQIGEEYIKQLNTELEAARNDLEEYGMVVKSE